VQRVNDLLDHIQTHHTGRTHLKERSAHHRELYLTTKNIRKRQTSMHPAGFETKIPATRRPQTHALDCVAIGIGTPLFPENFNFSVKVIYWYSCSDLTSIKYVEDKRALLLSTVIVRFSNDLSVSNRDAI
jgi:hypothetical protein